MELPEQNRSRPPVSIKPFMTPFNRFASWSALSSPVPQAHQLFCPKCVAKVILKQHHLCDQPHIVLTMSDKCSAVKRKIFASETIFLLTRTTSLLTRTTFLLAKLFSYLP